MKQKIITAVARDMLPYLNNAQTEKLQEVLLHILWDYDISLSDSKAEEREQDLLALFLAAKRIEGCSEKSLKYYQATTQAMLDGTSIHSSPSILVSYRALSRLANSFCSISDFSFFRVIKKQIDFWFLSALRIIIRLCESSRHPTKGKHHFYICQNGSLKFCRINGENPDNIGVFTGYIYFVALLWCGWQDLNLHEIALTRTWTVRVCQFRHIRKICRKTISSHDFIIID